MPNAETSVGLNGECNVANRSLNRRLSALASRSRGGRPGRPARLSVLAGLAFGIALGAAFGLTRPASAAAIAPDSVLREGEGARRAALNKRELTPFPQEAWATLSAWTNGPAITSEITNGRPVLIITWAEWYPATHRAKSLATQLAQRYAKEGLVVVLVHDKEGWDTAPKPKAPEGATLLVAHDAKNEFRAAIDSDMDPDFYIIDRAGQLRFADVQTSAVEKAVELVVKEAADVASGLNDARAAEREERRRKALQSTSITSKLDLRNMPEQTFQAPPPEEYENAKLPKWQPENSGQQDPNAPARVVALPEDGFVPRPPALAGRAVVLYFWNWDIPLTFSRAIVQMDELQREFGRDVAVIGVWTPLDNTGAGRNSNSGQPQQQVTPEEILARVNRITSNRTLGHTMLADLSGGLWDASINGQITVDINVHCLPVGAVLSSEGGLRYVGSICHPKFRNTISAVLDRDPGVKRRRDAEQAWIRANPQRVAPTPPAGTEPESPKAPGAPTTPPAPTGG
ncbi:MAG: hypothetical protein SFZ23_07795 [Planctomycetota bacterium]|nr:hypothetical protein [Planctomycetota bacterium]